MFSLHVGAFKGVALAAREPNMFRSYQPQQPCSWAWSCPHTGTAAGPAGPGVRRPAHDPEQNIAEAAAQAVPGCMNTNHQS